MSCCRHFPTTTRSDLIHTHEHCREDPLRKQFTELVKSCHFLDPRETRQGKPQHTQPSDTELLNNAVKIRSGPSRVPPNTAWKIRSGHCRVQPVEHNSCSTTDPMVATKRHTAGRTQLKLPVGHNRIHDTAEFPLSCANRRVPPSPSAPQ